MDFSSIANTPFLQDASQRQKKLVLIAGAGIILVILIIILSLFFNDNDYKNQFDRTISRQINASSTAELVLRYSSDGQTRHIATTVRTVSISHANELQEIKIQLFDSGFEGTSPNLSSVEEDLKAAQQRGSVNEEALSLLKQTVESARNEIDLLRSQSDNDTLRNKLAEFSNSFTQILDEI